MRVALGILTVALLSGLHLAVLFALLHPQVSREYRAHYIDRTSSDWDTQHYFATPQVGIDLTRPGWPSFVDYSFGISRSQSFGRWTDTQLGLEAGFQFNRSFSGPVCLLLNAMPSDIMRGRSLTLVFGMQEKAILLSPDGKMRTYITQFDLPSPSTRLELRFTNRLPKVNDPSPRELGVELETLRIQELRCPIAGPHEIRVAGGPD